MKFLTWLRSFSRLVLHEMNGHHGNGNEIKCKMLIEGPDDDDDIFSRTVRIFKT